MATSYKVKSIQRLPKDAEWKRYEVTITATYSNWTGCKPVEMDYVISVWRIGSANLVAWSIRSVESGHLYSGTNGGWGQLYQGLRTAFRQARKTFLVHTGVIGAI